MSAPDKKERKTAISTRIVNAILSIEKDDPELKRGDIAEKLEISQQSLTEILKSRQVAGNDVLQKLFEEFNIRPEYIFSDQLPIKKVVIPAPQGSYHINTNLKQGKEGGIKGSNVTENVTPAVTPNLIMQSNSGIIYAEAKGKTGNTLNESNINYNLGAPKVVTVNERREENIVYVPVKARAGYLNGYGDPEYISTLATYRLPGLDNATYRMFEVDGPSMAPNLTSGDRVIGQWVGNLDEIRDNRVHVIVTTNNGIIVKRIQNRVSQRGKLVIKSDTISHRADFPTYQIDPEEVKEIWYCRLKLSADFSEPAEVYHRLADLESDMVEVKQILTSFIK